VENKKAQDIRIKVAEEVEAIKTTTETSVVERELSQFALSYSLEEDKEKEFILNTFLSPNKNWRLEGKMSDYEFNGITQGFKLANSKVIKFELLLIPGYLFGLGLHVLTFSLSLIWFTKILFKHK
jgi:hypothetical protein